jgi:Pyridoxal-dependent decarboxylase conserved domain
VTTIPSAHPPSLPPPPALDPAAFRRLAHAAVDLVADYLGGIRERPVFAPMTPWPARGAPRAGPPRPRGGARDPAHPCRPAGVRASDGEWAFCVAASAGTVSTGAIDPLDRVASVCQAEDLWFHARLDTLNERLAERIQAEGRVFLTGTVLRGRYALRASVLHYGTTEADVDALVEAVRATGDRLARES